MAYLYRHIRLDKNEPFYIGIGSDSDFKRAYSLKDRNQYWHNIVNKSLYEVEILIDNIDWKFACEKEKEFIKLYGRKDLKKGTLVNLTDGGDGVYGLKFSNESKNKMSIAQKNKKPITEETRYRMSLASKSRDVGSYRRGKKLTDEHKAILLKAIKGVPKPKTQCPHCKLIGGVPQLKQWHFDKCKLK
jgi:hypothetical protein